MVDESQTSETALSKKRSALSDFDNVTVRIANVAANLGVLGYWRCDDKDNHSLPRPPSGEPECHRARRNKQPNNRYGYGRAPENVAVFRQSMSSQWGRPNCSLFVERRTSKVEVRRAYAG